VTKWLAILVLSLPLAVIFQVAVYVLVELIRYAPHVVCPRLEGAPSVACNFGELVEDSSSMVLLLNAALAGVPMLISYFVACVMFGFLWRRRAAA
jgi:hypothetical protein